jgi:RNA polymerase sigma-70 factor, ECF subfamily
MFDRTNDAVRRYALNRGMTAADAEDLVAEVFTLAWRRLERIPADDPIPWLFAAARNHWRNHLRSRRREREAVVRLRPAEEGGPSSDPSAHLLRSALATLSEADQEVLRLVAWDDLAPRQVAAVLGCSPGAARVRLHRARQRLATALRSNELEEVSDGR